MKRKEETLKLLLEGLTQRQVAKKFKVSESYISQVAKSLQKEGKLKLDKRSAIKIYLSSDIKLSKTIQSSSPIYKQEAKPNLSKQRIHRLKRSISLVTKPAKIEGSRQIRLNNNIQELIEFEGFTLRFTNNLLICEGIQLMGDYALESSDLLLYAEKLADATLHRTEVLYNLRLKWGSERTTIMEYAFTEQDYLKDAKKEGEKGILTLYWNPMTNKPEIWGDLSFNIGELETNKANHAQKLRALVKPIIENRWSIEQQLEFNNSIQQDIHYIARNLATHIPYMDYTLKVAKGIKARKPKPLDDRQRRLDM